MTKIKLKFRVKGGKWSTEQLTPQDFVDKVKSLVTEYVGLSASHNGGEIWLCFSKTVWLVIKIDRRGVLEVNDRLNGKRIMHTFTPGSIIIRFLQECINETIPRILRGEIKAHRSYIDRANERLDMIGTFGDI